MRLLALCALTAGLLRLPGAAAPARPLKVVKAQFPGGSAALLEKPDRLTLYELDPTQRRPGMGVTYFGYAVVRQKAIEDPAVRKALVDALFRGMADQKVGAQCFIPHHGLRAERDGRTVDLVLCFTCQWVVIHHAGKSRKALLSAKPMALYDKALR